MLSLRFFYGISKETAFQLQKERKKKKTKPKQLRAGWFPKPSLEQKSKIRLDLVLVATALSSKNPKKGPGKPFIQTFGHCILCLKDILGGNITKTAD